MPDETPTPTSNMNEPGWSNNPPGDPDPPPTENTGDPFPPPGWSNSTPPAPETP